MRLPRPRGPLGRALDDTLRSGRPCTVPGDDAATPVHGDAALTLWVLHELHYRGFDDADLDADRRPDLLELRVALEHELEARWRDRVREAGVTPPEAEAAVAQPSPDRLAEQFFALCELDAGPSVARFVQREATVPQLAQILRQRSIYHTKEQDAATWAVPRVPDETKAHLVAIAADEYGNGRPEALHARLWADGIASLGLDAGYGAYVDDALPEVLEQNNLMSMLGLGRRFVPAALGHLAAFEVTSAVPARRMARGLERLGVPEPMVAYYREHMVADAVHEQVAVREMLGSYLEDRPGDVGEVWWGAAACLLAEGASAEAVLAHVQRRSRSEDPGGASPADAA